MIGSQIFQKVLLDNNGIIPPYVILYFPEHVTHYAICDLFLRRKPFKINEDKCTSPLRNAERRR